MEILTSNQAIGRYKRILVTNIKKNLNKNCKSQVQEVDLEKNQWTQVGPEG